MSHPTLNHWHTSKINFGSEQAAKHCLTALEQLTNQKIIMHGQGAEVLFEGYFDFAEFDVERGDEFSKTISEFCQVPCEYAVKSIFNDADGYFGGWVMVLNEKGEVLKESSLNEIFESIC